MEEEDDDEEEGVEKGEPGEMPRRREEGTVGGVDNADHHIETAVVIYWSGLRFNRCCRPSKRLQVINSPFLCTLNNNYCCHRS